MMRLLMKYFLLLKVCVPKLVGTKKSVLRYGSTLLSEEEVRQPFSVQNIHVVVNYYSNSYPH